MFEDMKNGIVSIKMFGYLDAIAERHGVKDIDWAKVTDIHATRISEWRRIYKAYVQTGDTSKIGRAFTNEKWRELFKGLRILVGDTVVNKEMLALISKAEEKELKIMLALHTLSPEKVDQLWMYVQALAGINGTK